MNGEPISLMQAFLAVYQASEPHRLACEARHVCAMADKESRRNYLADVAKKRGQPAADDLAAEVTKQWEAK